MFVPQLNDQWGRDDSEDYVEGGGSDGGRGEEEDGGCDTQDGDWYSGGRSSDTHASYFRDGRTRVDYVLVFEGSAAATAGGRKKKSGGRADGREGGSKKGERNELWRTKFMASLFRAGLLTEEVRERLD